MNTRHNPRKGNFRADAPEAPEPPFTETAMPYFHFRTHASQPRDAGQPENACLGDDDFAEATLEGIKAFADGKDAISLEELRAETG